MAKATVVYIAAGAYTQVHADVTAVSLLQVRPIGSNQVIPSLHGVELIADSALPDPTDEGLVALAGDVVAGDALSALGTGAVYAKALDVPVTIGVM
jgi:hypothetical protein